MERRIAAIEKEKAELFEKSKLAEEAAKNAENEKDGRIRELEKANAIKLEKDHLDETARIVKEQQNLIEIVKKSKLAEEAAVDIASARQVQIDEAAKEKKQFEETERQLKEQHDLLKRMLADAAQE